MFATSRHQKNRLNTGFPIHKRFRIKMPVVGLEPTQKNLFCSMFVRATEKSGAYSGAYRFEVSSHLFVHLLLHIRQRVTIDAFHDIIRLPSPAGHDVLIRDPDRMQDAGPVVPEIMHAEMREPCALYLAGETVGECCGRVFQHIAESGADSLDHAARVWDCPI